MTQPFYLALSTLQVLLSTDEPITAAMYDAIVNLLVTLREHAEYNAPHFVGQADAFLKEIMTTSVGGGRGMSTKAFGPTRSIIRLMGAVSKTRWVLLGHYDPSIPFDKQSALIPMRRIA